MGNRVIFLSSSFFPMGGGGGLGSVREQIGPISLYMLVGGGWRRTGASFASRGLLACFLPFLPAARGDERVCVFLVRDGRQTGGQTQKMKEGGLLGSSEMKCTVFPASGLGLLMLSSQGTHSCGRRSNNVSPREEGPNKKGKGQRDIYTCRCVFALRLRGNSCQISRYLDDIYTWKLQPT